MQKTQITLGELHMALTICQLAIHQAREAGDETEFYEFLAAGYIDGHLNNHYEIVDSRTELN